VPFNGSGTFSIINTFVPNTTILSAAVNQNYTDIATGLSDCLTRDGQAGMTAALKAVSGSVSAPGISFNSDATAGLYLPATGELGLVAKSLGLIVNSSILQVASAAVQAGGSGYVVGDTITETGGTAINQAVLTVATLSGSAVATVTVTYPGNYTVVPTNPVSQGSTSGSGTGCTLNLTFATQYTRSLVTSEAGALPWQRLGASSYLSGMMAKATAYDFLRALATFSSGFSLNTSGSVPVLTTTLNPTLVPNYISGLTLSTAGSSGTMSIAAGVANDSTNTVLMNLASAISKTTASWAVGTGNGGLDTGSIAGSTWYHVYEIERVDTGVVDVVFSLSASAPTLPTNYTIYRRIGSMLTDGSNHWVLFTQIGNRFIWSVSTQDINTSTLSTTATLFALTVPSGVNVTALLRINAGNAGGGIAVLFSSPSESDQAPSTSGLSDISTSGAGVRASADLQIITDTSRQVRGRSTNSSTLVNGFTYGWIDFRGQG
jgi:hypothetical protein